MQEDKEGLFDTVDTLLLTLEVFTGMVATLKVKGQITLRAAEESYILATDLADYLVGKGVPFREAHGIVGQLVQYVTEKGKAFRDLSISEYKSFSPLFGEDVCSITVEASLGARNVPGGTGPGQVAQQLARARNIVQGKDDK
jgi:argininosuccinate lyase